MNNFDTIYNGIGEMFQRPKPDRTPSMNPRIPKPRSGPGSVLRTLALYGVIIFTCMFDIIFLHLYVTKLEQSVGKLKLTYKFCNRKKPENSEMNVL